MATGDAPDSPGAAPTDPVLSRPPTHTPAVRAGHQQTPRWYATQNQPAPAAPAAASPMPPSSAMAQEMLGLIVITRSTRMSPRT